MTTVEKVTLTLPHDLMETVREIAPPRGRSKFIAEAVRDFIERQRMEMLRADLIAGYQATAAEATATAEAWMPLGQEAWDRYAPINDVKEEDHGATTPAS